MSKIYSPVIDLESSEVRLPDRHNVDTAFSLARTAFVVSNIVVILYMTATQYLLFRIRFSKSRIRPPNSAEKIGTVITLWIVHRLFDVSLSALTDGAVKAAFGKEIALHYRLLRYGPAFDIGYWVLIPVPWTWRNNTQLIFWEVLVTWFLYFCISLSIILIPLSLEARQNPRRLLARGRMRWLELITFAKMMFHEEDPVLHFFSTSSWERSRERETKKIGQTIQLQRHQEEVPFDRQRILNWDLGIDKEALAEMMETLGPPGGFGELGFNITTGKVCFGAMGIGTRFNLNFVLEPDMKEEKLKESKVSGQKKPRWRRAQSN